MSIENFKMPVGRIVAGNPAVQQQVTDFYTKQVKKDELGQPLTEWRCEIAYPKQEFLEKVWPAVAQEVSKLYPQYANIHPDMCDQSKFAFKIVNGDSSACPKGSNTPYNTREGYQGCYIVKIRTAAFAPGIFKFENGAYRRVEANEIKTGDYVVANLNITAHTSNDGGIYWNPNGFELVGYGTEIKGSGVADPMAMFGGQTYQLPAGASAAPVSSAPATAQMPMPASAQNAGTPQAQPQPMPAQVPFGAPIAYTAQPQPMPAPAYDFVQNAGMPMSASQAAPATPQSSPFNNTLNDYIPY